MFSDRAKYYEAGAMQCLHLSYDEGYMMKALECCLRRMSMTFTCMLSLFVQFNKIAANINVELLFLSSLVIVLHTFSNNNDNRSVGVAKYLHLELILSNVLQK